MSIPPVRSGYQRQWYRCDQCGHTAYRDFIPYSMSNPILTAPCGHDFKHHYKPISDAEAGVDETVTPDETVSNSTGSGVTFPVLERHAWRSERPYLITLADGMLVPAYPIKGKVVGDHLRVGGTGLGELWLVNDSFIENALIEDYGDDRIVSKDNVIQWLAPDDVTQLLAQKNAHTTETETSHEH